MAKVRAPQGASAGQAEAIANGMTDAFVTFELELNKQRHITMAGGSPTWTTADTLYAALKA